MNKTTRYIRKWQKKTDTKNAHRIGKTVQIYYLSIMLFDKDAESDDQTQVLIVALCSAPIALSLRSW